MIPPPSSSNKGQPDGFDFSYSGYELGVAARHPYDDGVWLGDKGALRSLPKGVDAVMSMCRVGNGDLPARAEQLDVRLIDRAGETANLNFVLVDTVRWLSSCVERAVLCGSIASSLEAARLPSPHSMVRGCTASAWTRH